MPTTHPTLYKKNSAGKIQHWTIRTEHHGAPGQPVYQGIIFTHWGVLEGEVQETHDVVREGKNPGKKNATTPFEQADLEAQSKWEKQLKKGYVRTIEEALAGAVDDVIEGGINPMLAHPFKEHGHKIKYPCFTQPKFDGHRCTVVVEDGKATMWTRTRRPITGLPHIIKDVEAWAARQQVSSIILDGELYNHEYRDNFEELSSFIRTPEPQPGHEVIQYHIYDVANDRLQASRLEYVRSLNLAKDSLVGVETITVSNEAEVDDALERFLEDGYEGLILRNSAGKYVNKRSYDLQKYKLFQDAEFTVVGVNEGRGKLAGHAATFECITENREYPAGKKSVLLRGGDKFRAKLKGKLEELKKFLEHPELAVGKRLTVQYQGISKKNFVPRFPVALRFREDL